MQHRARAPLELIPQPVAIGDFNGDGNLDLAVAKQWEYQGIWANGVAIFLGNGDGTFNHIVRMFIRTGSSPTFVMSGDFNSDGKLDLAVGDMRTELDERILLGNGDGTFTAQHLPRQEDSRRPSYWATSTRTEILDLAVSDDPVVTILLGNGDGTFHRTCVNHGGQSKRHCGTADFNGDGKPDLAVLLLPQIK